MAAIATLAGWRVAAATGRPTPSRVAAANAGERVASGSAAATGRPTPSSLAAAARVQALRKESGFLGVPVERAFTLPVESSSDLPFTFNLLVVLVEFSDVHADRDSHPPAFYHRRFFEGVAGSPSLNDYYRDNSGGRFQVRGLVTNWVRLDSTYASYAAIDPFAYPHNVQRLVEEAVARIGGGYRWQDFDNDKDGLVDGLFVIHAGPGGDESAFLDSEQPEQIVAHQFRTTQELPVSGARVFDYAISDESARLGIIAHEFGHLLGLIDLYQTGPYAGVDGPFGLGDWSLMGTGALLGGGNSPSNLDAWSRSRLGFISPVRINGTPGEVVAFRPAVDTVLQLWGATGEQEYFLVEDRYQQGFDAELPGRGLLIYHVDESVQTNSSPTHPRVRLLQADGAEHLNRSGGNRGDIGDPFPNVLSPSSRDDFDATTFPGSLSYSGRPSNVSLYNIHRTNTGYEAEVVISRHPGPHLVDFRIHETGGDGDGQVERGEVASVDVTVENSGPAITGGDLFMVFSPDETSDLAIETMTNTLSIGNFGQAERRTFSDVFSFRFRADAPDSAGAYLFHAIFSCSECGTEPVQSDVMVSVGVSGSLSDDFESGAPGWTHAPIQASMPDPWHISTERFHSAGHSFAMSFDGQNYDGGLDAVLVSPVFPVPDGGRLTFWHLIDAESLGTGRAWDGGLVEISISGGEWREIEPVGGYPFRIESGSGNPLFERGAFSGHSGGFRREIFDLSALAGSAARVRFRFGSDFFGDPVQVQRGWFIDDLVVSGGNPGIETTARLLPRSVEVSWSVGPDLAAIASFNVLRREDFENAAPALVAHVVATGGTPTYTVEDAPPPGRYVYEVEALEAEGPGPRGRAPAIDVPDRGSVIRLARPFPSPYRVSGAPATFEFFVPESAGGGRLTLDVIDVSGRFVSRLVDGPAVPGNTRLQWTGETPRGRLHSGVYYLRLSFGGTQAVQRLMVIP